MLKNKRIVFLRFLIIILPCIEGATRLNEYIRHYEPLDYDPVEVHERHLRTRRSVGSEAEESLHLSFNAHKKTFKLRLKRDTAVFSNNFYVESDTDALSNAVDTSHVYHGHLDGVANSEVFGSVQDGVFEGKIITPDETYYVERAHKYPHASTNASLHSVIYTDQDVQDPYEHMREGHAKGCGITDEVMAWMQSIQNSAEEKEEELRHPKSKPLQREGPTAEQLRSNMHQFHDYDNGFAKYLKEANAPYYRANWTSTTGTLTHSSKGETSRGRRASGPISNAKTKTTCPLSIQTDPLLWKHIVEQMGTTDEMKIREEILSLIAQHVKEVNRIYSNTLFKGKGSYNNVRFEVQRIKIDTDKACKPDYKGENNLFCLENIDVSNFLNLHSLSDHDAFCLAYVFTYRDFTGGTLGLAWVASASGASGGVCEKYKTYTETIQGVYQSTKRSLNTGIITFVNYNSRVPPKVSQLTLAHEIGHNFGSPHDFPLKCRPGGLDGNYIMFASATSGDRPNNSQFSDCSKKNISSVLDAIIYDSKKNNCFIATNGVFCGNKIVEDGEECDCGFDETECEEQCCYPRTISPEIKKVDPLAQGCRRKPGKQCSPSEGPCCDATCTFVSSRRRQSCKPVTECSQESFCNGAGANCPEPEHKPTFTPCNNGTQVCQNGECRGSICLKFNLTECFLNSSDKSVDKRKLCELACMQDNQCRSTSELNLIGLPPGLSLRPGAPCDNFQGYCDVFLKCRAVDAEGPLARLKNLLFNKQTLLNIATWVTDNWWAVVLMGVGFIIFMGLFIKCCAVHTPSSNPKKPPARRIGDTLRRPINTLRRHRQSHYHRSAAASANGGPHMGAPPPYSASAAGPSTPARPAAGPHHGFGEGRGPNRSKGGNQGSSRTAGSHPYGQGHHKPEGRRQQHRV